MRTTDGWMDALLVISYLIFKIILSYYAQKVQKVRSGVQGLRACALCLLLTTLGPSTGYS